MGRIGAGVTTFDEPAGTTGFVPRISLGVSRINLFGEGRTISLQTRFSTIEQRALLSYVAPQFLANENLTLTISGLFDNSRDIRTFAARRYEASVQLAERLSRANSVQYRVTFRNVKLTDLVVAPELIPLLSQPDHTGLASMTFIQDRRDDPIDSHRGIYNTIDAGIALISQLHHVLDIVLEDEQVRLALARQADEGMVVIFDHARHFFSVRQLHAHGRGLLDQLLEVLGFLQRLLRRARRFLPGCEVVASPALSCG